MRLISRKSVLYRYLVTYIGIAIVACSILGTILLSSGTRHLMNESRRAECVRLDMARDDLVNTLETMESISMQIRTSTVFQPFFLSKGAINHMTMLEIFKYYRNYSPLIQEYYLYYPETSTVFTPWAEYRFYLFASSILNMDEETVSDAILSDQKILPISGEKYLLSFPVVFIRTNSHSYAYLLFELDMNQLSERFASLYMLSTPIQISFCGQVLQEAELGSDPIESKAEVLGGELSLCTASSQTTAIQFQTKALLAIVAVTLAISILSSIVAWKTYLPIRKLASKAKLKDETEKNEMKRIEDMIEGLSEEKQVTMGNLVGSLEKITVLTKLLRNKIIFQLLSGETEEGLEEHIQNCGMVLNRPFLCALHICTREEGNLLAILASLEESSTENLAVYGIMLSQQDGIGAIVSANESEELGVFCTGLESSLFNEGFEVTVQHGRVVNRLSDLSDSFFLATSQSGDEAVENDGGYDSRDIEIIRRALLECDREKALSTLDNILVDIMNEAPSMLMQRYYVVQLTYQMVSAARECRIFLPDGLIQQVVMAENSQVICNRLRMLLNRIFDERLPDSTAGAAVPEKNQKLIDYINEHAFDYNMCLDLVASEFNVSTKQVSRIVKVSCGETFKDYLLRLRMDKAVELLKQGVSPAEVTTIIGYTDERYFKKRFYEHTGDSVMKYQAMQPRH